MLPEADFEQRPSPSNLCVYVQADIEYAIGTEGILIPKSQRFKNFLHAKLG